MAKRAPRDEAPADPVTRRDGTSDPSPGTEPEASDETPEPAAIADDTDPIADHRAIHGTDSIVRPVGDFHIRVDGRRYTHVGDWGHEWVYRPD